MKETLLLFLLSLSVTITNAQVFRRFLNENGDAQKDSIGAKSYILVRQQADSVWSMMQYSIADSLMIVGTFKDANLSIPNGKFSYYKISPVWYDSVYDKKLHKYIVIVNTAKNYVNRTVFFANGQLQGRSVIFKTDGSIDYLETYTDGKLNGPYQRNVYADQDSVGSRLVEKVVGIYENNLQEGNWYNISSKGDTSTISIYSKGKLIKNEYKYKHILHRGNYEYNYIKGFSPGYNVERYINQQLPFDMFGKFQGSTINLSFDIDRLGKLSKPKLTTYSINPSKTSDLYLNSKLIEFFLNAPRFKPVFINYKPENNIINIYVKFSDPNKKKIWVTFR